jgi:AMP-activated protein kinase-like protein
MEYLISMYIDDELDLDDKILFLEKVRSDKSLSDEAVALLQQEKMLRSDPVYQTPVVRFIPVREWKAFLVSLMRPIGFATTGFTLAVLLMVSILPMQKDASVPNRFVIYKPDIKQAEIAGTFTDWERLPMKKIGSSGYWEITLNLPEGEHRFTYILEGNSRYADPTILMREKDDFGGENAIIHVGDRA